MDRLLAKIGLVVRGIRESDGCAIDDAHMMTAPEIFARDRLGGYHPEGASKAAFFEAHGIRRGDWQALAEALRDQARRHPVADVSRSPYGLKYAVNGPLLSPDGRMPLVRTIWIVDAGAEFPRLVTAYPMDLALQRHFRPKSLPGSSSVAAASSRCVSPRSISSKVSL